MFGDVICKEHGEVNNTNISNSLKMFLLVRREKRILLQLQISRKFPFLNTTCLLRGAKIEDI